MEYTFKGTPGPWSVDGFNTTSVITKVNEVGWRHVCNCSYGYAEPEKHVELNTANAHLIAAAPDLLQACIADVRNTYDGEEHVGYQVDGMNGKELCTFELTEFDHACQYIESLRKAAIKKALNL